MMMIENLFLENKQRPSIQWSYKSQRMQTTFIQIEIIS